MGRSIRMVLSFTFLLFGCGAPAEFPAVPADHPANPKAELAPVELPRLLLGEEERPQEFQPRTPDTIHHGPHTLGQQETEELSGEGKPGKGHDHGDHGH